MSNENIGLGSTLGLFALMSGAMGMYAMYSAGNTEPKDLRVICTVCDVCGMVVVGWAGRHELTDDLWIIVEPHANGSGGKCLLHGRVRLNLDWLYTGPKSVDGERVPRVRDLARYEQVYDAAMRALLLRNAKAENIPLPAHLRESLPLPPPPECEPEEASAEGEEPSPSEPEPAFRVMRGDKWLKPTTVMEYVPPLDETGPPCDEFPFLHTFHGRVTRTYDVSVRIFEGGHAVKIDRVSDPEFTTTVDLNDVADYHGLFYSTVVSELSARAIKIYEGRKSYREQEQ